MTKRFPYRALILCGALGALFCAAADAGAQPVTDPNKRATELYKKGNDFYDKSKWSDAENMYRAAFDLRQSFDIAGNLGDVEMINGKPRDAAEHLSFAIRNFPATGKPAQREALRKRLGDAANLVGTVNIKVSVPAAEVIVDGKSVGKSPLEYELYVDRGDHVVEAKKDGYEPAKETIKAGPGTKHDVSLTLKEKPKAAPVTVKPVEEDHGIFAGKNLMVIIGGGVITTAGLAVGLGTAVASNGKASDADAQIAGMKANGCAPPVDPGLTASCNGIREARKDQDSLANASVAAFVVGGLAAAGTVTYLLWPAPKSSAASAIIPVPVVTANEGGLWIKGTF